MQTLARVLDGTASAAEVLPDIWPSLSTRGIHFRRGQVSMIAGPPNAGKSFFALILAAGMGVPTLYFSADTDEFTMLTRAAALVTGDTVEDVERGLREQYGSEWVAYSDAIDRLEQIAWVFDSSISLDDIDAELRAYVEVYGEAPTLIVVDNLLNVSGEHDSEWAGMLGITKDMHYLARISHAHVMLLHHTQEHKDYPPNRPAPRRALMGKVAQMARLILTVAMDRGHFAVAAVKNTNGPHDATGADAAWFYADPARMALSEALEV